MIKSQNSKTKRRRGLGGVEEVVKGKGGDSTEKAAALWGRGQRDGGGVQRPILLSNLK